MNFKHKNSAAVISGDNYDELPEKYENHFEETENAPTHEACEKELKDGEEADSEGDGLMLKLLTDNTQAMQENSSDLSVKEVATEKEA